MTAFSRHELDQRPTRKERRRRESAACTEQTRISPVTTVLFVFVASFPRTAPTIEERREEKSSTGVVLYSK